MKKTLSPILLASFVAAHSGYPNLITQWPTTGPDARGYYITANGITHQGPIGSNDFYDSVELVEGINRAFASVSISVTSTPTSFTESSTVTKENTYASAWSFNWGTGDNRWRLDLDTPTYITIESTVNTTAIVGNNLYTYVCFSLHDENANKELVNYVSGYGPLFYGPQLLNPGLYVFSARAGASDLGPYASASYSVTVTLTPVLEPPTLLISLTSSNYVRLSWPTQASGYFVESSPDLTPGHFTNIFAAPVTEGAYQVLYLPMTDSWRLFRLAR